MSFQNAINPASGNMKNWLKVGNAGLNESLERLSSGFKIKSAGDDAAGSAIALKLNMKVSAVSGTIDNRNAATGNVTDKREKRLDPTNLPVAIFRESEEKIPVIKISGLTLRQGTGNNEV